MWNHRICKEPLLLSPRPPSTLLEKGNNGGLGLGEEGQACAHHVTIPHFLILDLLYKKKAELHLK